MTRIISWFSCGAASAVATKLALLEHEPKNVVVAYCETGSEHEDNSRFMADCVKWFNAPVVRIKSDEYADTWDVWEKTRWLAGINGARCTTELKVAPRLEFQKPTDKHVFGYTADAADVVRAKNLRNNYPEMTILTPLIDAGINKAACLSMVKQDGIALPPMYAMGFQNNNCIPCVKATSPDYWALVRKQFPEQFNRMAKLSRDLDVRLCRIKGERSFIDEIPADQKTTKPIQPSCDFLCHIAEIGMDAALSAPAQSKSLLSVAQQYIGWHETKNSASLKKLLGVNPRRTPWCAAFVSAIMRQTGRKLPHAPNQSSSWRSYGKAVKLSQAQPGDILVMPHHVSIFSRRDGGKVCGIGGNQKNSIRESCYPASIIKGVRR